MTPGSRGGLPGRSIQGEPVRRVLTLWRNGFTIDQGPLYPFSEPESIEILREIRMGRVPRNVAGVQMGENVEMKLEKRETEDWTPAARTSATTAGGRHGTFVGHGNRLGRYVPFPNQKMFLETNLLVLFLENLLFLHLLLRPQLLLPLWNRNQLN